MIMLFLVKLLSLLGLFWPPGKLLWYRHAAAAMINEQIRRAGGTIYITRRMLYTAKIFTNTAGDLHRIGRPAVIIWLGGRLECYYYRDGKLHREDGPAQIKRGPRYYICGKKMTAEQFYNRAGPSVPALAALPMPIREAIEFYTYI